jgi:zinc protease
MCTCWDEEPLKGLDALGLEFQKVRNQEFSEQEFEIALANYRSSLKQALENIDKHKNTDYVGQYIQHFMHGGTLFSFEESAKMGLELINQIPLKEVNARRPYFFNQEQSVIYFPSDKGPDIVEDQMLALLSDRELSESSIAAEDKIF